MEHNELASINLYNTFLLYGLYIWIPVFTPPIILFTFTFQVHLTTGCNGLLVNFLAIAYTYKSVFSFQPPFYLFKSGELSHSYCSTTNRIAE